MSAAPRARLAILLSGRGSNMAAIAAACAAGRIDADVALVLADRADAPGLQLAASLGLETAAVPRLAFADRDAFERALCARLAPLDPALVLLAGFMRVLGAAFVGQYAGRLLNIHPSLLPRYKGLATHQRALDAGDLEHGASVHFVTAQLDGGPVVLQGRVPVLQGDDAAALSARVQQCEHRIYPRAVHWFTSGRLRYGPAGVEFDGQPLTAPIVEDCDVALR